MHSRKSSRSSVVIVVVVAVALVEALALTAQYKYIVNIISSILRSSSA